MKKIIYSFIIIILTNGHALCETFWETYLEKPTPENAFAVDSIKYSPGAIPEKYGYWSPDLSILRNQVLGGDHESFRLAYRLILQSDGALAEELTMVLSHSIRPNPTFFLKHISKLKPNKIVLNKILLMPGLEYVDRFEARQYEIDMRRNALAGVTDVSLISYRDYCLEIMKDM
jgi:hypothetical protein